MNTASANAISAWEGEGGAPKATPPAGSPAPARAEAPVLVEPVLVGTEAQIEWAARIRDQVNADFDRVAASFRVVAGRQIRAKRAETESILAILEDKRAAVMASTSAGYFIHEWQETGDRVRKLIFRDPRYQAIKAGRAARHTPARALAAAGLRAGLHFRPLAGHIVIERDAVLEASSQGLIIPGTARTKPQQGQIIAAGRGVLLSNGQVIALDVKVGDCILFGKEAGTEVDLAGATFLIMREQDVLAVLDTPSPGAK